MKALLSKLFGWFRKKKTVVSGVVETKGGQVVTDYRPKQLWYSQLGPPQIELFDNNAQAIRFLKECGAENIKLEVVTPVKEGKTAVVFRRITKTPVV